MTRATKVGRAYEILERARFARTAGAIVRADAVVAYTTLAVVSRNAVLGYVEAAVGGDDRNHHRQIRARTHIHSLKGIIFFFPVTRLDKKKS